MTALNANSKADTLYLALRTAADADLAVDLSQERTNLVANATYHREAASARTAITAPREITVRFTASTASAGIIVNHGDAAGTSYTYRVRVDTSRIDCYENGLLRVRVTLPSIAVTERNFVALWSTRAIGGGLVRSEVTVYNLTSSTIAHGFADHALATTSLAYDLTIAGYGAGVSAFPLGKINGVRIGQRFHSQAEFNADWLTPKVKPTLEGVLRDPTLPIDHFTNIGDESRFAGPAYLFAGAAARDADKRLLSPMWNARLEANVIAKADHTATSTRNKFRPAPDDTRFYLPAQHWVYVPVPMNVNRVRVRAFVQETHTGAGTCPLYFRAYSIAGLPFYGEGAADMNSYHTSDVTINTTHTANGGDWIDLGFLPIAVDDWGFTSLVLAHSFNLDVVTAQQAATRLTVWAVTAEPFYLPSDGGGFDVAP